MKNKKGFTLVEVVISIAALGIICAVLLRLFVLAGNTNTTAGEKQDAQLAVVSCAEVLLGAETLESGLAALGAAKPDGTDKGSCAFEQDGYTIVIDYVEEDGGYPGTLYGIRIEASGDGKTMAAVSTKKYDREQPDG